MLRAPRGVPARATDRMRILYLTDLHLGRASDPARGKVVWQALVERVASLDAEKPFEMLLLGGDLAFSGRAVEYQQAASALATLRASLTSPQLPTVCVPGNHDVDRSAITGAEDLAYIKGLSSDEARRLIYGVDKQRALRPAACFANFKAFAEGVPACAAHSGDDLYTTTRFKEGGLDGVVVGINTAILCGRDGEESHLPTSDEPWDKAILEFQRVSFAILLTHHSEADLNRAAAADMEKLIASAPTLVL